LSAGRRYALFGRRLETFLFAKFNTLSYIHADLFDRSANIVFDFRRSFRFSFLPLFPLPQAPVSREYIAETTYPE
jgi:hypothetical protein